MGLLCDSHGCPMRKPPHLPQKARCRKHARHLMVHEDLWHIASPSCHYLVCSNSIPPEQIYSSLNGTATLDKFYLDEFGMFLKTRSGTSGKSGDQDPGQLQ